MQAGGGVQHTAVQGAQEPAAQDSPTALGPSSCLSQRSDLLLSRPASTPRRCDAGIVDPYPPLCDVKGCYTAQVAGWAGSHCSMGVLFLACSGLHAV